MSGTVVKHLPRHPKVKGLSPAAAGNGKIVRSEKKKKVILTSFQKGECTPDNSKVTSKGATTFTTTTFCRNTFRSIEFDYCAGTVNMTFS